MTDIFDKARDLFIQGLADLNADRLEDARSRFLESLEYLPGRVSTLTNLAATQLRLQQPEAALQTLGPALDRQPDDPDVRWQQASALAELHRFEEAAAAFVRFLELHPDHAEGWVRHGQMLQNLDRHALALDCYDKALALDPGHALAWSNRGHILRDQLRLDDAAHAYERAIECGGDADTNRYFIASVTGSSSPASAPEEYVQNLFDVYADTFDTHLVQVLHYRAHTVLARHLRELGSRRFAQALDLGCGTGLCGALLRPFVGQLHGVDLSPGMLAKAETLGVYSSLVPADVASYLRSTDQSYDLVVAADVFTYLGDLVPVFAGVARVLRPDGLFCFSIESTQTAEDYELKTSLRFGHSQRYVRELARDHGMEVVQMLDEPIREELKQPIDGSYIYLRKP